MFGILLAHCFGRCHWLIACRHEISISWSDVDFNDIILYNSDMMALMWLLLHKSEFLECSTCLPIECSYMYVPQMFRVLPNMPPSKIILDTFFAKKITFMQ